MKNYNLLQKKPQQKQLQNKTLFDYLICKQ